MWHSGGGVEGLTNSKKKCLFYLHISQHLRHDKYKCVQHGCVCMYVCGMCVCVCVASTLVQVRAACSRKCKPHIGNMLEHILCQLWQHLFSILKPGKHTHTHTASTHTHSVCCAADIFMSISCKIFQNAA